MSVLLKPFDIAIIGGGIAGCVMSISLTVRNVPHTLYESASGFGDIGAGLGFEPHFVNLMKLVSPELQEAFLRITEQDDDPDPVRFTLRVGDLRKKDALQNVPFAECPSTPGPRGGVHRAQFLNELIKLLPKSVPKFRKRLVDITEAGNGDALLRFADGTTAQHSAIIGCDGIKSRTRELVLGGDAGAIFSGKYAYRGLVPMSKATEILGVEVPKKAQLFSGYNGHVLTYPIAKGSIMNVVAFSSCEEWKNSNWVLPATREEMLADYKYWNPTVQSIIAAVEKPDVWALFDHPPARTYYQERPRVCLVGDAAHASTPHQGSGAGMCIEDCYFLGELLGDTTNADELIKAFWAYDDVRRHRTQRMVRTSREAGMLYEFEAEEKDDLEAIAKNIKNRMDWICTHNIAEDVERAKRLLRGEIDVY